MPDPRLDISIGIEAQVDGAIKARNALDDLKVSAGQAGTALGEMAMPEKIDTAALVAGTDKANLSLNEMRKVLGGLGAASQGSVMGLARATEGIGKLIGVSDEALRSLTKLSVQAAGILGAFEIGSAVGDSIYKNIVTPIWDAVEAHKTLGGALRGLYSDMKSAVNDVINPVQKLTAEEQKAWDAASKARKEIIAQHSAEKQGATEATAALEKLTAAKLKYDVATGKITPEEAKQQELSIAFEKEMASLMDKRLAIQNKMNELFVAGKQGTSAFQKAQGELRTTDIDIQTAKTTHATAEIELGKESKKVLADLETAIKSQQGNVDAARGRLTEAQRSGGPVQQGEAYKDVQEQESLLNQLKAQFTKISGAMKSSLDTVASNVGSSLSDLETKVKSSSEGVTAAVSTAAANTKTELDTAASAATQAMNESTGKVSQSVTGMGQIVAGAITNMGGQLVSAVAAIKQSTDAQIAQLASQTQRANANASLALEQVKNSRQ